MANHTKKISTGPYRSATTIKGIAKQAGVSTATVSRVISSPEKVKGETRDRVLAIMKKNHFVADGLATGLASQRSKTIGLIIPTIANSIYSSSTQAIQKKFQAQGYTVLVCISEFSPLAEADMIHRLLERRVDGLILTGATRDGSLYEKIAHYNVPFVITWQLIRSQNLPAISFDNYKAALTATEHLIDLGHQRIGLICGRTEVNDRASERRRAYEECLPRHGIALDPNLIYECEFDMIESRSAMTNMLANHDRPTAVFCANDIQAIGAIAACRDAGFSVPGDISIIGFDDLPIARCTVPLLTTIRVPAYEMGERAADALIDAIRRKGKIVPAELPTELILRDSTAALTSDTMDRTSALDQKGECNF